MNKMTSNPLQLLIGKIVIKFMLFILVIILGIGVVFPSSIGKGAQGGCYFTEDSTYINIGNDDIGIVLKRDNGGIYSIIDKATNVDFIKDKGAYWSLYDFCYLENDQTKYVVGSQTSSFNYQVNNIQDGLKLNLYWVNFSLDRIMDIKINASITILEDSGLTNWSINIENNEYITITGVDFPAIAGIGQISKNPLNDYLVFPNNTGLLFQDPVHNFKKNSGYGWEMNYPSGQANMQFIAYYSSENYAGLYMASTDTQGYNKFFNIGRPEDWMNIGIRYTPSFSSGNSVNLPYSVTVGVFSGDWYTAAQIYRNWAIDQWWCNQGTIYERTDTPLAFKQMASLSAVLTHLRTVNVINNGTPAEIVKAASDYLDMPVLVSWWGWEKDGWYENYPEVFPPYGGWDSFDTTIDGIHQAQGYMLACICTDFYSMDIPSWNEAKEYAVLNKDGTYIIFPMTSPLVTTYALMDPSTQFYQDVIYDLSMTLINHGVDFLWMDGFPIVSPRICYNSSHSHPIGGGNWWFLGYQQMFQKIRSEAKAVNPNFAMSTEGMAEVYIPYFDSFYDPTIIGFPPNSFSSVLNDIGKVNFIPLWDTVYHDYITTYATLAFLNPQEYKSDKDFYIWGIGTNLNYGKILEAWTSDMLVFTYDTQMSEYYKRTVQARYSYASQFLIYGQMLHTPSINTPDFLINGATNIPYTGGNYPPFSTSSVPASAWQSPSGDVGYIFTNISHDTVSFNLTISPSEIGLSSKDLYTIIQYRNGISSVLQSGVNLPQTLDISIDSLDVLLIKVVPTDKVIPPSIITDYVTNITTDSVTLNGKMTDFGSGGAAQVSFEWGLDISYGNETPNQLMINAKPFSFLVIGLNPNTVYHFRVKAKGDGVFYGIDSTFTTLPTEAPTSSSLPTMTTTATSSSSTTQEPLTSEKSKTWMIVGIVGGIIALILLSVFVIRRRVFTKK